MAKIKITAGKQAVEEAGKRKDFVPPRPGLYVAALAGVEVRKTKDEQSEYVVLRWQPTHIGRNKSEAVADDVGSVWDNVTFDESTDWKRAQVALALGAKPNRQGNVTLEIEPDESKPGTDIGKEVLLKVKAGKNLDGDYRAETAWVAPFEADADEGEGFQDDDEDEGEAVNPFDDDAGTEVEGGSDEPDEDLWTAETLSELEPKELAEACREFDLDPDDLKVKVKGKVNVPKTLNAMVSAILEAQNGTDDGDDEDPF